MMKMLQSLTMKMLQSLMPCFLKCKFATEILFFYMWLHLSISNVIVFFLGLLQFQARASKSTETDVADLTGHLTHHHSTMEQHYVAMERDKRANRAYGLLSRNLKEKVKVSVQ